MVVERAYSMSLQAYLTQRPGAASLGEARSDAVRSHFAIDHQSSGEPTLVAMAYVDCDRSFFNLTLVLHQPSTGKQLRFAPLLKTRTSKTGEVSAYSIPFDVS
jgi:hypothetical protein